VSTAFGEVAQDAGHALGAAGQRLPGATDRGLQFVDARRGRHGHDRAQRQPQLELVRPAGVEGAGVDAHTSAG
jgi:hypothetical protein